MQELAQAEKIKKEKFRLQKDAAARADRAWEKAASATREGLQNMSRSPKTAGEQLALLSRETASTIAQGQEVLLHLLGDKKDQGPQFHALNAMTLCMLVGKKAALSEVELADLALAALAHDAGKSQIPPQILKTWPRKKHEEDFYRQHVQFSVEFAAKSGAFSREALAIIAAITKRWTAAAGHKAKRKHRRARVSWRWWTGMTGCVPPRRQAAST
jgi:HD-GYP domain-containing protein (c-di-GMP phosphodiesterase class II)